MTLWDRIAPPPEAPAGIALPEGGFKLKPYRDSAGYPTIGAGSRTMPDGSPVTMASPAITQAAAEAMFIRQLAHYAPVLAAHVARSLTTGQAAALMSMLHNCGEGCLAGSVIQKAIAAGDMDAALLQLPGWCEARNPRTGASEPSLGLMHRRQMDGLVWSGMAPQAAFQQAYGPRALTFDAGMALYRAAFAAARAWGHQGAPVTAAPSTAAAKPSASTGRPDTASLNDASAAGTLSINQGA